MSIRKFFSENLPEIVMGTGIAGVFYCMASGSPELLSQLHLPRAFTIPEGTVPGDNKALLTTILVSEGATVTGFLWKVFRDSRSTKVKKDLN